MRVGILAHLLNFSPGYRQAGVSRYVEHLLRTLPWVAPDDEFVVYAEAKGVQAAAGTFPPHLHWSWSRLPTARPPVRILWEQLVAPAALPRQGIDVVHAPVNVAPLIAGRPAVVTVHDLAFERFPEQYPGAKQRYLSWLTRRSVEHASRVVAVSEHTRQDILEHYRVDPARVTVVPNGVDASFQPITDRECLSRFRAEHDLPEEFVLFVGTLQPRKNLIGLLRAWSRVRTDVPLVVVGGAGWQYAPIFEEVSRLGIGERVVFNGYADDLPLWYSAATVFVYPSLYEGFGLPVLEAMACGAPVVTSNTSSLPEVAGDAALLVDPLDPDALAAAIESVLESADLRAALGTRGTARAQGYTWERTARETLTVYRRALGSRLAAATS